METRDNIKTEYIIKSRAGYCDGNLEDTALLHIFALSLKACSETNDKANERQTNDSWERCASSGWTWSWSWS